MEDEKKIAQEAINKKLTDLVVHLTRIFVKIGIIIALKLSNSPHFLLLTAYTVIQELIDQVCILIVKKDEKYGSLVKYIYSFNSITYITVVMLSANWITNDFYLIYLIHISSAIYAYGIEAGFVSGILSLITYSLMLLFVNAPAYYYVRNLFFLIISFRLFTNQYRFEKVNSLLTNVLSLNKTKKDFISIAAHNLRTPIAAIDGYIELILGASDKLKSDLITWINHIRDNNQELKRVSEQLLQISILEIGKEISLIQQPVQLEKLIEEIINNLMPLAKKKEIALIFNKSQSTYPIVNIDTEKIRTVITNLVDNAIKYTDKGGVTVKIEQIEYAIQVSVSDTGVGITKEDIAKLFTEFYRSGNILVYNKPGTGLGLYLCKKIIEGHKGNIWVESTEGKGSTFYFTLPVKEENELA